jgi:hypothetical protein
MSNIAFFWEQMSNIALLLLLRTVWVTSTGGGRITSQKGGNE